MNLKTKLTSRKFWIAIAAALASIGGSIAGIATDNQSLASAGLVCTVISAAIYAAAEAYVDGKSAASNVTYTTKQVSATSTDKATVQAALAPVTKEDKHEEAEVNDGK